MQEQLFDRVSVACSRQITRRYSTSFTLGIQLLAREIRGPIYSIYGFVRLADEIVDTFHEQPKETLFDEFKSATLNAITRHFSLNPVLHAFQGVVHRYGIETETITRFLDSMEMDLEAKVHDRPSFENYILGSAEVVGLMCLRVFTGGDQTQYEVLKPYAMRLGAAFQKINFLRDIRADYQELGRVYFPGVSFESFSETEKNEIEREIQEDFDMAVKGIRLLPDGARLGVYTAYLYYRTLFEKIRRIPASSILNRRIRISNLRKLWLMCTGMVRHNVGQLS
jgi:phytoene/squalene synthetase